MATRTGKKKDGKWTPLTFWLELVFVAIVVGLALYKGPDRFDLIIAIFCGYVWGYRIAKDPCMFKRIILRQKCD